MPPKTQKKPVETIKVDADIDEVVCDGGGGPLGHPQVWYSFGKDNTASCHYCGRKFIRNAG